MVSSFFIVYIPYSFKTTITTKIGGVSKSMLKLNEAIIDIKEGGGVLKSMLTLNEAIIDVKEG